MPRRAVLTTTALVVGLLGAAPAVAGVVTTEPTQVCVLTQHGPGEREGICVWVPVEPPLDD